MHYHALHVYFFLLSYALPLAVILCLSSLSLSLLISLLVMEPKKSVPSENLIRHDSSSSSFPSDSIWFCDEKARDDFFENFSNWVIHLER